MLAAHQHVVFASLAKRITSAALAAGSATTLYHPFSSHPGLLYQPPSQRLMELPTQKQDMMYKWKAERAQLFLHTESHGLGYRKTTAVANAVPHTVVGTAETTKSG